MLDSTTYLKVSCSLDALAAMYGTPNLGWLRYHANQHCRLCTCQT